MSLIDNYNTALQALYDHVGFTPDWVVFPVADNTSVYWKANDDTVRYADTVEQLENDDEGDYCEEPIERQRFYEKWVYTGEQYTMIFCDSGTDGMDYFRVFANDKRQEWLLLGLPLSR